MKERRFTILTLSVCLVIFSTSSAHAYLDPGAGSLILQVVLGGIAGLGILRKLFWNRFKTFLQFGKQKNAGNEKTEV